MPQTPHILSERTALALSHIGFFVRDIERMTRFYLEVLHFTVTDEGHLDGKRVVFLSREPSEHHQIVMVTGRPEDLGFSLIGQLSFRVPSLAVLRGVRDLAAAHPDASNLQCRTHGNTISVYFEDPDRNRIEVLMDTPWYCEQPTREAIDLDLPDDVLLERARAIASNRPRFQPRPQWQAEMARQMGYEQGGAKGGAR